jgi:hypothetical protein
VVDAELWGDQETVFYPVKLLVGYPAEEFCSSRGIWMEA